MTREKAAFKGYKNLNLPIDDTILWELINEIYDDFESKTCENCKYLTELTLSKHPNNCKDTTNYKYSGYVSCIILDRPFASFGCEPKDFGCNKWEITDEDN